jgi:hypothetical protein
LAIVKINNVRFRAKGKIKIKTPTNVHCKQDQSRIREEIIRTKLYQELMNILNWLICEFDEKEKHHNQRKLIKTNIENESQCFHFVSLISINMNYNKTGF